jgi:predicted deacylase
LLWINGAVHGDEINGALAAVGFFNSLTGEVAGSVVATPVSNVLALDERRKSSMIDGLDMDQSFPGRHDGLATERIAATLFETIGRKADIVVNLHTLGAPFDARPYAVYKIHPHAELSESTLLQHIACFTPEFVCRMPVASARGELPGNVSGALDYQCLVAGKTAFMIELGAGGRYDEGAVRTGIDGLLRLSRRLAMTAIETDGAPSRRLRRVTGRRHVMADAAGFFLGQAQPGRCSPNGTRSG